MSLHAHKQPRTDAPEARTKVSKAKPKVRGFGHSPEQEAHHFVVVVPKAQAADVMIYEVYQEDAAGPQLDAANLRCILARAKWLKIVDAVEEEHNKRLRGAGMKAAAFKAGETPVARLLGKELVLLAWAIEDADASLAPAAIENWRGLSPEERWWLYTMTAAQTGHHGKRNIGWRKAVRCALTENPVIATPTVTTAEYKSRAKGAARKKEQGKLFGLEETPLPVIGGYGIWGAREEQSPEHGELSPQLASADMAAADVGGVGPKAVTQHLQAEAKVGLRAAALTQSTDPPPLLASREEASGGRSSGTTSKNRKKKAAKLEEGQGGQGALFGFEEAPLDTPAANGIGDEPCKQPSERKKPKPGAAPKSEKKAKASSKVSSRSPSSPRSATRSERRMPARP